MSRPAPSPSRAADFKQCPLLYRFRAIDRLPEAPSVAQLRGSVVHGAGDFRPNPSRLCNWCAHRARCPAFGGPPPSYPGWPTEPTA